MVQRRMPGCITVNRHGRRFFNEAASYDASWRAVYAWENFGELRDRNLPAFHVSDKKVKPTATVGVHQADTLAELAGLLGIDPPALEDTVAEFNENVLQGSDPHFHRGESRYDTQYGPTLAPLDKPPFYGVEVAPADLGTCGGARVNANAQVLDPFGKVIARFYAAGNSSGVGGPGAGYGGGGGTIGPAMTFAYIAGVHAAGLERSAT
jgi:succinate dehydrogenase/fumarate reductase flavoprotein subunit